MTHHSVIITENAQCIGAGISPTLPSAGAKVLIAGLNGDPAKETAAAILKEAFTDCRGIPCAVTSLDDLDLPVGGGGVWRFGKARL